MLRKLTYLSLFIGIFTIAYCKNVILLTGLPCAGKTTIAKEFHRLLPGSVLLDGDEVRKTINKDLAFTKKDREENLRRVVEMTKLVSRSSEYVILSFVSPYENIRTYMKNAFEKEGIKFYEVFVNAPLKVCIQRDVKGMYQKAIDKKIPHFTGITDPYDVPKNADLVCYTDKETIEESVDKLFGLIRVANPLKKHAVFIGRWTPFHKGHFEIMRKVYEEDPSRPLLVLVREREIEHWSSKARKEMVETSLRKMNIPATVQIIPDIDSVNWGRDVGYTPRMISVDNKVAVISGTDIRNRLKANDPSWKQYVCDGVDEVIEKYYSLEQ